MPDSLLDKISESHSNRYITDRWSNGKTGEIVDILSDGNYRFVDYIVTENGEIRKRYMTEEEESSCPIVACGIVGNWLQNRNACGTKALFDNYFAFKTSQYEKQHELDDNAWERDLKKEFAMRKHIPEEKEAIKKSEAIFDFLTEEDNAKIKKIAENYLKYVRDKRRKLYPPNYPNNKIIEETFFEAYRNGGARFCVDWFREEYGLSYMGPHWGEPHELNDRTKHRHNYVYPQYIKDEFEDFDDKVLVYSDGGMMEEINENLKNCPTKEDRVRYIVSILQPFKEFADAFYPKARIDERKKAIVQDEKWKEEYSKIPKDAVDERTGKPINPDAQIGAIEKSLESYKKDIGYWEQVQDRFYWFAQHGLTGDFSKDENPEMCEYLGNWWHLMIIFARRLAALALTYGIRLMDVQEHCGIYLTWHFVIHDYIDDKYILTVQQAEKLLNEIELNANKKKNGSKQAKKVPVYVSYNWSDNTIAETICTALTQGGIEYRRDAKDCPYHKNIRKFEEQLGEADLIIAIISETYIRSIHCMRELALISQNGKIEERLFAIVEIESRNPVAYTTYINFWKNKQQELYAIPSNAGLQSPILEEQQDVDMILNEFPSIWKYIRDINSPSWEKLGRDNCKAIINEITNVITSEL